MEIYWRHEKGGVYRIVDFAVDESTCTPVVIYQEVNKDDFQEVYGHRWVRPCSVFFSGKFSQVRFEPEKDVPAEGDNFRQIGEVVLSGVLSVAQAEAIAAAEAGFQVPRLKPVTYPDFPDETFKGGPGNK